MCYWLIMSLEDIICPLCILWFKGYGMVWTIITIFEWSPSVSLDIRISYCCAIPVSFSSSCFCWDAWESSYEFAVGCCTIWLTSA